jgi:hypothetical protein
VNEDTKVDDPKTKSPFALWGLGIVGAVFLYVASIAPVCWFSSRIGAGHVVNVLYRPITRVAEIVDQGSIEPYLKNGIVRYASLGNRGEGIWFVDSEGGLAYVALLDLVVPDLDVDLLILSRSITDGSRSEAPTNAPAEVRVPVGDDVPQPPAEPE